MWVTFVESFIDALHRGATRGNILSGFRKSGIFPFDPMIPLSSQFAVDPPEPGIYRT
jgi:hypothetical protein